MIWFTRWLSLPSRPAQAKSRRSLPRRGPLFLECLEERTLLANVFVVPFTVPLDGTHFHALAGNALSLAGNGGSVTIEPGVQPDPAAVNVNQTGIVIQGDPNIPGDILPSYDLNITVPGVRLANLRLGTVTISAGISTTTVEHSVVNTITETSTASGNGGNTFTQNQITGSVTLFGNTGGTVKNNDVVTFNAFTGTAITLLTVDAAAGVLIQSNSFVGEGDGQAAIAESSSGTVAAPLVIANNTIGLSVGNNSRFGIALGGPNPTFVRVLNNTINTDNLGIGLNLYESTNQNTLSVLVQGNDFHGNDIGVRFLGNGTGISGILNTDLGGGPLGSLGGNDFRSFTAPGATSLAAILMTGTASGATLPAANNIFGTAPNLVVDDSVSGTTTGTGIINVSALDANRSFVQTLYNNVLGRSGSLPELDYWVSILNANSQATVVNGLLRSSEALGRIVDSYYLQFLGRQSDPDGRNYWIGRLQAGVSEENVMAGFASAPEFLAHIDTDFVQALYLQTFHRTGNATELAYWNQLLPTMGLQGVAAGFTTSTENRSLGVANDFQRFLHRGLSSATELSNLTGLPVDLLTLEADVLASAEFFTNG